MGTALANLPGLAGFSAARLIKISVWGADNATTTSPNSLGNFIAVKFPGDTSFLDANTQTFEDYGVTGEARPNLHLLPSFIQRTRWYAVTATDTIFSVINGFGSSAAPSNIIVQISVELQTLNETPAYLH
jgi:hypothetical protein